VRHGGEHAASSASRWRAHGEGVGGASLFEASGDGGNRRDRMALTAVYALHQRHQRTWASREEISNNKIWEVIVGTNLVNSIKFRVLSCLVSCNRVGRPEAAVIYTHEDVILCVEKLMVLFS
jgi:hypothetical protein